MMLVACFAICVLTVPLAGGDLAALASFSVRRSWAPALALAIQVAIISVVPEGSPGLHAVAHLVSYAFVLVFLAANRDMPGLWLVGVGTGMNIAAIAANRGVMPATRSALEIAGQITKAGQFANSTAVAHPKLAFLGDIFAVPGHFPLANVFSPGDVCIVLGAALVLHQVCRSRLALGSRPAPRLKPLREPEAAPAA